MKTAVLDSVFGILIIIAITIAEFIVTLPFGMPGDVDSVGFARIINRELLLTALPAGLITFAFAHLRKTNNRQSAVRISIIWTVMIFLNYLLIGVGNKNLREIFGTAGIYTLLACACVGPLAYYWIFLRRKQQPA